MENNDINRLIELLEKAEIRDAMTEGFDQWNMRRASRRQALRRTCVVLLLAVSAAAFAITVVPGLHRLVFPADKPADTLPSPTTPQAVEVQPVAAPPDDTATVVCVPQAAELVSEPVAEPVAEAVTPPPKPRYDFLYIGSAFDTLACFLMPDMQSVAVACIASAARIVVPDTVWNAGIGYAVTALADSAFFSMTAIRSVTLPSSLAFVGKDAFSLCFGIDTVVVLAVEPPVVEGEWCFFGMADSVCLMVPCGSAAVYRAALQWDGFEHVVDPCEPQQEQLPEVTIIVNGNTIVVEGADDEIVDVYDAQGRIVATTRCKGRCSLIINRDDF